MLEQTSQRRQHTRRRTPGTHIKATAATRIAHREHTMMANKLLSSIPPTSHTKVTRNAARSREQESRNRRRHTLSTKCEHDTIASANTIFKDFQNRATLTLQARARHETKRTNTQYSVIARYLVRPRPLTNRHTEVRRRRRCRKLESRRRSRRRPSAILKLGDPGHQRRNQLVRSPDASLRAISDRCDIMRESGVNRLRPSRRRATWDARAVSASEAPVPASEISAMGSGREARGSAATGASRSVFSATSSSEVCCST